MQILTILHVFAVKTVILVSYSYIDSLIILYWLLNSFICACVNVTIHIWHHLTAFYHRLHHALQYVLWIRCPLTVILVVYQLRQDRAAIIIISIIGKLNHISNPYVFISKFSSLLMIYVSNNNDIYWTGLAILANAFVSLILFFYSLYENVKNINGLPKLVLLKLSVVLIVLQGTTYAYFYVYL